MKSNLELMQNVVKPYIDAKIQALTNYVAEKNVKNILPETIATQTNRGVTFTVNSDGSITLSGTCNATASVTIAEAFNIKAGNYVYSKGATTGSATMYLYDTTTIAEIAPTADHVEFNIASDRQIMARFYITNGTTYNATVYPMIVEKSVYDADPTYQPYAKTNVELTQDVAGLAALIGGGSTRAITGTTPMSALQNGVYSMSASESTIFDGYGKFIIVFKYGDNSGIQIAYKLRNNADVSPNIAFRYSWDGTYSNWAIVTATNQT